MRAETLKSVNLSSNRAQPSRGHPVQRLDQAPKGHTYTVRLVEADPQVPERARQLEEIGFYPGERVTVMTRGFPGGDPIVVRIGQSTFALRGAEAACVHVEPAALAQ